MDFFKFKSIMDRPRAEEVSTVIVQKLRGRLILLGVLGVAYVYLLSYKLTYKPAVGNIVFMLLLDVISTIVLVNIIRKSIKNLYEKTANTFVEQVKTAYQVDHVEREIEFHGEDITFFMEEGTKNYKVKSVEKVLETEHVLVLVLKGSLYLWLEKDSIEGGDLNSFRAYLGK